MTSPDQPNFNNPLNNTPEQKKDTQEQEVKLTPKQESFWIKNKNKLILAIGGLIGLGSIKAGVDSIEDFKNNPDNQKFAAENTDIKDIQKTWERKDQDLKDQVQSIDEASK